MIPLWLTIVFTVVGSWIGFFFAALLCAAGRADERMEQIERRAEARQGGDQL